jgi:hypothetical protein
VHLALLSKLARRSEGERGRPYPPYRLIWTSSVPLSFPLIYSPKGIEAVE